MPKRLAITGPRKAEVLEYEDQTLQPYQVKVRTELASGKHGTMMAPYRRTGPTNTTLDEKMRIFLPVQDERSWGWGPREGEPFNTGTSGVGVVEETGAEVTRWKAGDRVFGPMDIRETNICWEADIFELGEIPPEDALCIEPAYVSFHCVREGGVRVGDDVAVVGLGALGMIAVKLAVIAGAARVFAIDPIAKRREWCQANGATAVLDPLEVDAGLEVHKQTDGKGVDVAIETAGVYPALHTAIRCARMCGTVVSAGFYQEEAKGLMLGAEWHHNRLTMIVPHGCGGGHLPRDYPVWDQRRANEAIVHLMRTGRLSLPGLVHPIVSLDEGPATLQQIDKQPEKSIKFAVRF
ncbi:MAG: zinc-binding dehydrogenase [Armatimonadetes bacterium]|nr:zinc-binding dehydrogenase [Armatimonadota bacterium]NIM24450.1 zinc-binding dehydrogenase [Armatimonadota bacterium]NIM68321.1 zinc-binding dehydrogenase [Armatimonadota bacterium]NIM76725.1 zinc-binding dehydrogenase [Armatimonadota bacterium]NIN06524.1 zinc-binding dehydrogenase [Armatimonadota bacterium]